MGSVPRLRSAVLALLLAAAPAPGGDGKDGPSLGDRVRALVERLEAGPAEARAAAVKEFAALGLPAIEFLPARAPRSSHGEAWAALEEALAAMGPAQAAADLRSSLGGLPGTAGEVLAGLAGRLEARAGGAFPVALVRGRNGDPTLVPFPLVLPLEGEGEFSGPISAPGSRWSVEKGRLRLDSVGKGRFDRILPPGKAVVIEMGEGARPILFAATLGRWTAAPAEALLGRIGPEPVLLLDADGDGSPTPGVDWIRVGEGCALRRFLDGELHWTPRGCVRLAVAAGGGASLLATPEPLPSWADAGTVRGLEWINRWRRGAGLPPYRLDRRRSEGCRLHAEYMAFHGVRHEEEEGTESWTALGAAAGMSSSIGGYRDLTELFDRIHATVLHRDSCIGSAADGVGLGAGRGGTVAWASPSAPDRRTGLLLVPAPGQRATGLVCGKEMPIPDVGEAFYASPRGYPVSVTPYDTRLLADCSIELFEEGAGKPVPGFLFTPAKPYSSRSGLQGNNGTAQFVAEEPLRSRTSYTVRFTGRRPSGDVVAIWSFTTP